MTVTAAELREASEVLDRARDAALNYKYLGSETYFSGTANDLRVIAAKLEVEAAKEQLLDELAREIRSFKYPHSQDVPWDRSSFQKLYLDTARGLLSKYDITPKPVF